MVIYSESPTTRTIQYEDSQIFEYSTKYRVVLTGFDLSEDETLKNAGVDAALRFERNWFSDIFFLFSLIYDRLEPVWSNIPYDVVNLIQKIVPVRLTGRNIIRKGVGDKLADYTVYKRHLINIDEFDYPTVDSLLNMPFFSRYRTSTTKPSPPKIRNNFASYLKNQFNSIDTGLSTSFSKSIVRLMDILDRTRRGYELINTSTNRRYQGVFDDGKLYSTFLIPLRIAIENSEKSVAKFMINNRDYYVYETLD
jgi:hypothetical protein